MHQKKKNNINEQKQEKKKKKAYTKKKKEKIMKKQKNTEKYENKIQILKKLQKNFYRDGIQMIALSQLLLLLYILAMTDGMRQKAFRRCFLRQMNPLKNFFQITNFI